jgi:hypothetical protein
LSTSQPGGSAVSVTTRLCARVVTA